MSWVFRLYVSGLIVCPLLMVYNDLWSQALAGGFCLLLLLMVLFTVRPGEASFGYGLLKPFLFLGVLPAIWMIIQIIPSPLSLIEHFFPAWIASRVDVQTTWATLSIDLPASFLAIASYLCALAFLASGTYLAIDRSRAERLIVLLTILSTAIAMILAVHDLGGFFFLGEIASSGPRSTITSA